MLLKTTISLFILGSAGMIGSVGRGSMSFAQGIQALAITATPLASTLKIGGENVIFISIKNVSDHPIRLARTNGDVFRDYDFTISFQGNSSSKSKPIAAVVQKLPYPVKGSARSETLQPGESIEEQVVLAKHFDMSKPGTYTIRVTRSTATLGKNYGSAPPSSNVVRLQVVP